MLTATMLERQTINEYDAKRLLRRAGVPTVEEKRAATIEGAAAAAAELGYPVALKVLSDEIAHKSEHGLVALALEDETALRRAWHRFQHKVADLDRGSAAAFLVQRHIADGIEVFAGINRDPQFGPCIAFGLGGTMVELFGETSLRLLPLREGEAEALVAQTRAATLLKGYRGAPGSDLAALYHCLYAVADFAWSEAERIEEIDLNPIIVLPEDRGCLVVDALIVPRGARSITGRLAPR